MSFVGVRKAGGEPTLRQARLLADWRAASWRVREAWDIWLSAGDADRTRAHALYVSALAEEELAAERLQREADAGP